MSVYSPQSTSRSQNAQEEPSEPTFQALQLSTDALGTARFAYSFLLNLQRQYDRVSLLGGRTQAASSCSLPQPGAQLAAKTRSKQRTRCTWLTKRPPTRGLDSVFRPTQHLHTQPYNTHQQEKACLRDSPGMCNCQKFWDHDSGGLGDGQLA